MTGTRPQIRIRTGFFISTRLMKTSSRLRRLVEGFPDLDNLVEGELDDHRVYGRRRRRCGRIQAACRLVDQCGRAA
jgi:hypothetical protein